MSEEFSYPAPIIDNDVNPTTTTDIQELDRRWDILGSKLNEVIAQYNELTLKLIPCTREWISLTSQMHEISQRRSQLVDGYPPR